MTGRFCKLVVLIGVAFAFVLTADGLLPNNYNAGYAEAQQVKRVRKKRRTLLQVLFGGQQRRVKRIKRSRRYRKKRRRNRRVAVAPYTPRIEKLEDARVVLVVGDFFAAAAAKGLARTFDKSPGVRIVKKTRGSSGFARLDYYDWAGEIGAIIDEQSPTVVVAMIGTNDRQLIRHEGKKLKRRSDEWDIAYKIRVENFAKAVRAKNIPLIWLGLPPVRFKKMNQDFLNFNEIYRGKTEKTGGQFIDVWDGFTDAEGNFVTSGPNVAGQIVRLRSKDGINVTRSGQDKLAFYAEKLVRKFVGGNLDGTLAGLRPSFGTNAALLEPTYDPKKTGRTIVINLDDPSIDGGAVLAGGPDSGSEQNSTSLKPIQEKQSANKFVVGRVDDYSWPRKSLDKPLQPKPNSAAAVSGRI